MLNHLKKLIKNTLKISLKTETKIIEHEAFSLELALNVSKLCENKIKYEKEEDLKPILLWAYWTNRATFEKKF